MATCVLNDFMAECALSGVKPPRCLLHQLETHAKYVEVIRMRRVTLTPDVSRVLSRFIARLPNLERIDLEDCLMSYLALEPLCEAIASLRESHPCFELKIVGLSMGPRTKAILRQLYLAHSGITIVINGEEENFPSRMQSFRSMRRPDTPPSSNSLTSHPDDEHPAVEEPSVEMTEEDLLEERIAGQMARLCAPVKNLYAARFAAAAVELAAVEETKRLNLEEEEAEAHLSLKQAAAFETPFKPPEFNPNGPLCSPLRLRRNQADPLDGMEAELEALKERLFLVEDALNMRQHNSNVALNESVELVTVDGRALRRRRVAPGETAAQVAARFNVTLVDLELANKNTGIPDADSCVLIPLSLEALLIEQLVAERAQAIRATHAVTALTKARATTTDEGTLEALQRAALAQVDELHARSTSREETQAKIRSLEFAVYEHKRDSWLRFLKHARELNNDCEAWVLSLYENFDESLHLLRRQFLAEQKDIRELERRRQIPPEEVELRMLKRRCQSLEQKLTHATEAGSSPVSCM